MLRGHKLLEVLAALGYVDPSRVAAHGHSMGAFVTTALVGVGVLPGQVRTSARAMVEVRESASNANVAVARRW